MAKQFTKRCSIGLRLRGTATLLVLAWCSTAFGANGLTWKETNQTLRMAAAAKSATVEFRFVNSGPSSVSIATVKPSCDCLTARADKVRYTAGENGSIRVEFAPAGAAGRVERTIAVATDDAPDQPTILKLAIEISEPVAVRSRFVSWQVGEAAAEKEIEVIVAEPKTAGLGEVLCPDSTFSGRVLPGDEDGRYRLRIKPASTAQRTQATLRLNATVGGQPRVFVLHAAVK